MNIKDHLKAARRLIEDPKRWTQNSNAKDIYGKAVYPTSPRAVCWCAVGALQWVDDMNYQTAYAALFKLKKSVIDYNDTHTHAQVLALFDEAIKLA